MWPWSRRAAASTRKKLTAFVDEGSQIEGKYTFTGTVLLNGKFQGEIASPDTLIIGERGVVNAIVRAGTLVVNGELVGNVYAQFDLNRPSYDLINADYLIGLPLTFRFDRFSGRARLYHQSSHLGDEFVLAQA